MNAHPANLSPRAALATEREIVAAAYDPEIVREAGRRMIDALHSHFTDVQAGGGAVLNWHLPETNVQLATDQLRAADTSDDFQVDALTARFEELVRQILNRGQNLHHPHYMGHQVPASLPLAGLFDAVTALTNQVMAIYEMGPWATAVEHAMINEVGQAIGFAAGQFGGLVTSGGSLANLTALLTARNVSIGDSWKTGLATGESAPVLVAHAEVHYSVTRAAGILGLGTDQIVRVPLDSQRRMDVAQLDDILADLRRRQVKIVAVCAAACATPTGAFDPLRPIAEVCRRHQTWLHVDAAHGGAACLSEKHRHWVEGLELADSVVCDAHKMMFMPALCAFVFYRNYQNRYAAFQQVAPYLFDPSAPGMAQFDNGITNVECTKRAAAIGLWGVWSMFGRRLFAALVDLTFDLADRFYHLLSAQNDFEAFCRPSCNIVVFRYLPAEIKQRPEAEIDAFQLRLRRSVIKAGEFYLVQTTLDGRRYLRTTLINPLTDDEHLNGLLHCLREHGSRLLQTG
ncbi:MAG: aminotransferase class I/II-fold pyridoxal phosphate-dependent enzyme [Pirellulales bacterium]|nr:aminotransferase class I/II-fold pyridoxal phosphate-dependent enzyme [Pirellulales bacterium]